MRRHARPDPIRVVEAAYAWMPDEASWLSAVVEALAPYEVGGGVIACIVRIAGRATVSALCRTELASEADTSALRDATEGFPAELANELLAPSEFIGNAAYRLARVARSNPGAPSARVRRTSQCLPALWAQVSGDPRHCAILLGFPGGGRAITADEPFPHRDARALGLVGAHLAAALRLRTAMRAGPEEAEAVLTPRGSLLHAAGPATSASARSSLVEAVQASELARGRMRRTSPDEALALWTALVEGRWTIIDSVARDGKRLLLAHRNPIQGTSLLTLSADERDVAWLAAFGHSYKYIAYELGIPMSTVASRLRRAMRKLRVRSRIELLQKMGAADRQQ